MTNAAVALLLFQKERGLLFQDRKNAFRNLREKPRQRHLDAQRVLQHLNPRGRGLTQCAHDKAQRIAVPSFLLDRDQRSKVTVGAREAVLETVRRLDLTEPMANDDRDDIAHCNCMYWGCL